MKNLKIFVIVGGIIAVAAIITLMYVVFTLPPEPEPVDTSTNNSEQERPTDPSSKRYINTANGFSFIYPNNLKTGTEDFTYVPSGSEEKVALEAQFVHEIPVEYCAASGECRPTTQDFEFGVSIIESSLAKLRTRIEIPMTTKKFGDVTAYIMNQGVEGEGINYYFVVLDSTRTLMFDQRYIDENILISYKTAKDFIPFAQQNKMMETIISSLTFTK